MDKILQHIEKSHDEWLKTENISFEEKRIRAQIFLDQLWYIKNDNLSQSTLYRLGEDFIHLMEDPSQSNHICTLLEEIAEWGGCLKRMSKVWPCLPSKQLTKTDEIGFENQQLNICYDYLVRHGYFIDCAVSHAIRIQDNIFRLYEDCEIEFSDISTIQSKTHNTNKSIVDLENRFMKGMKDLLLRQMKQYPFRYSKHDILYSLEQKIFSPVDLISHKIIKDEYLCNYNKIEECRFEAERSLIEAENRTDSKSITDGTDVFFIGLPATGRSCLNAGLLKITETIPAASFSPNPYSYSLVNCIDNHALPPATTRHTAIQLEVKHVQKKSEVSFNLIEMSGDLLREGYRDGILNFNDIDLESTRLLGYNNRKILFIVIDPTYDKINMVVRREFGDRTYFERVERSQQTLLTYFLNLLEHNNNFHILKNIDAIHVIVSKYDTLEESISAADYVKENYELLFHKISWLCKSKKLNQSTNYIVQVIPFSLGRFYAGGYYDYEPQYSQALFDFILKSTATKKKNSPQFIKKLIGLFKNQQ